MRAFVLSSALLALLTAPVTAAVVDFEDIAVGAGVNNVGGDRVSGGFTFDAQSNHLHLANDFVAANGTTYLVMDDYEGTSILTMSKVGGGTFSLLQLDVAEWANPTSAADKLSLTGNVFGGGVVNAEFDLDQVYDGVGGAVDFQTFVLGAGWSNLVSVEFKGTGSSDGLDYAALDNITVGAGVVPEPGTISLLGLGGLALTRRRRRAN